MKQKGDKTHASRQKWAAAPYQYNLDPILKRVDGFGTSRQLLEAGGEAGTAWTMKGDPVGRQELRVSIEHRCPGKTASKDAIAHLKKVEDESFESLVVSHREWWHQYYPKSFISLDNTRMVSFYWIQVYKFGAGARKGRAFMDTMGPWIVEDTAWASGWFNLNTQLSYWFLSTANRLEVAESLFSKLDGETRFVAIKSNAGEPCVLKLDFQPSKIEGVKKSAVNRLPDGRISIVMEAGEEAVLFAEGVSEALVKPVLASPEGSNSFGLNP